MGFLAFSVLSSAGYLHNDAHDAALDRMHPRKRTRPIAAGRVQSQTALRAAAGLAAIGLAIGSALGVAFLAVTASYIVGVAAYTLALRRIAIVDVCAVAGLFVLRVLAGAIAIGVVASPWILGCTFAGALFVVSVKREQDRWLLGTEAGAHRHTLGGDARWPRVLTLAAGAATAGLYASYAAFATTVPAEGTMLASAPFVVLALVRYWLVARAHPDRDADEVAFRDPWVLLLVVGFLVTAVSILAAR